MPHSTVEVVMSLARPAYFLEACNDSATSPQPGFERRTASVPQIARGLGWRASDRRATQAGTSTRPGWLWPNLLSLDAPLIAVLWLHLFAAAGHIRIAPLVTVSLVLVV